MTRDNALTRQLGTLILKIAYGDAIFERHGKALIDTNKKAVVI